MAKGLVIYTDGTYELKEFKQLKDYQDIVGGYIEGLKMYSIGTDSQTGFAYINEEGKLQGLTINRDASLIAWLSHAIYDSDRISGNMIIVGAGDDDGDDTDVAQIWVDLVQHFCRERKATNV